MLIRMIRMIGIGLGFLVIVSLITSIPVSAKLQPPASDQQQVVAAAPAAAVVTIELCAKSGAITTPDGVLIPIWGFSNYTGITGGNPDGCDPAQLPGPELRVNPNPGDTITINLHNYLTEPTSILFPGITGISASGGAPGFFTAEAPASDGVTPTTVSYSFAAPSPGTYLYESGTDVDKQVAMGLYGALIVGDAGGADIEEVLVLSEIDPVLNADPANFDMHNYHPVYWLINGKAYPDMDPIVAETGDTVLLRYLNAGATHDTMSLIGLYQDVIAKDGFDLPMSYSAYAETIASGETLETLVDTTGTADGDSFPLFNRQLHITNGPFGPDQVGPDGGGGMMTFIQIGANEPPLAVNDDYSVADDEILTTIALGTPPGVLDNDSDPNLGDILTAIKVSDPSHGNLTAFNPDGSFTYEPSVGFNAGALQFAGASDYASAPLDGTTLTALTIEMWLKPNATSSAGIFQWANALSASTPFVYFHDNAGTFHLYVNGDYRLTTPLTLNQWDHIAVTYDGTDWRLYQNGQEVGVYTGGTTWQPNASGVYLGNGYHGYWNGQIDDVRIWSVARSQTDIQNNLSTTLTGAETDLIGYWPLEDGLDPTADLAGSNDASLVNGPTWVTTDLPPDTDYFTYVANDGTVDSNETLVTINLTPATGPIYGVEVTPAMDAKSDAPGAIVAYTLEVTNTGNTAETFDVAVTGNSWATTTTPPATVGPLNPNESTTLMVDVEISAGALDGDIDVAMVTLTSQMDIGASDSAELTTSAVIVPPAVYGVEVTPATDAKSDAPGVIVAYTLQVTNTGNTVDTFDVATSTLWAMTTPATVGPLSPNISATLTVDVEIPASAADGDSDIATVTLTSQGDGITSDFAELTTSAVVVPLPVYGVEMTPATDTQSGDPGTAVVYTLYVTNTGDTEDTFDVAVSGNGWATETAPATTVGPLTAGASTSLDVTVNIPAGAAGGDNDMATITVTSQGDNAQSASSDLTTTANDIFSMELTPATDAQSASPGTAVVYTLYLTNTGNTADTFDIAVSGNGWATATAPAITLGPLAAGASTSLDVTVDIPVSAAGGDSDMATVTVTSQGDNAQSASSDLTTTANTIHVGDLDQIATIVNPANEMWEGSVTITVHGIAENLVSGATVTMTITSINSNNGNPSEQTESCVTNAGGYCTVSRTFNLANTEDTVTFAVDSVSHPVLVVYEASNNHDPDPAPQDSDGNTITVSKP